MIKSHLISISLMLAFAAMPTQAADSNAFRVAGDRSVSLEGSTYANMKAYVQASQFRERGGRCATDLKMNSRPTTDQQARLASDCSNVLTVIRQEYQSTVDLKIPVWFHVIQRSDGVGSVTNTAINAQIQVLNEDFQAISGTAGQAGVNARFKFELAGGYPNNQ